MSSNKTIVKNTIFLYIRMIVVMLIGFYTVRAILDLLGETDYGIYNVVGGVVSMFSFLNGTLASSSQRYFSVDLAKGDNDALKKTFNLNVTIFFILAIAVVLMAETVGLWFVNYKMTIPADRMFAANVVYQLSILTFVVNMLSIPYNALIIAHEKMKAFAQISIIEAVLKLAVVAVLYFSLSDKLVVYGILMLVVSASIVLSYVHYCHRHFEESRLMLYWNKKSAIELFSFSGWHFLGTISAVLRSQGINILINLFFNPAVNAARAVSVQVSSAVSQLSNNFFVAVKPQIYKSYANSEFEALHNLVFRSSIICAFLVSIIIVPLSICAEFVLGLWLKEVPEHTVLFTQLILWHSLVMSVNSSTIAPALATGKIKKFEIWTSGLNLFILPVSYFVLSLGCAPESTVWVAIIIAAATIILQAYFLSDMVKLPLMKYCNVLGRLAFVSLAMFYALLLIPHYQNEWKWLFVVTESSCILHIAFYYFIVFSGSDREMIRTVSKNYISKKFKNQ